MFSILFGSLVFSIFLATRLAHNISEDINTAAANSEVNCKTFTASEHCVKLGNKFYLIDPNLKFNWFDADRYCRQQKARLALIENSDEMDTIANFLNDYHTKGYYAFWLGATKLGSSGTFYEVESGKPLRYVRWGVGLPDDHKGPEDCLDLIWWQKNNKYIMNDDNCLFILNFICEFKEETISRNHQQILLPNNFHITIDGQNLCNKW